MSLSETQYHSTANPPPDEFDAESSTFHPISQAPKHLGRYEVVSELGRGGFGTVYVGLDPVLQRQVAIKVPRRMKSHKQVEDLIREARRLAQLNHDGIVAVYDVGEQDGLCYIVTALLQGESLAAVANQRRLAWDEAVRLVAAIADALAHAHARGMVHRDVKPGNVFLTSEGRPILLDFGLALSDLDVVDNPGSISGTPAYMSPEQARGQANKIDGRTDVYSLGIVLYQLLTGRVPFRSEQTIEILRKIVEEEAQPLRQLAPHLSPTLEVICQRAMAKRASERYPTAGDFATALRAVLGESSGPKHGHDLPAHPGAATTPLGPVSPHTPASRRRTAERRQVTVALFSFELEAGADPEHRRELEGEFRKWCGEFTAEHGGVMLPETGQEPAACFGYPLAHEDAASRAVRAALQVVQEAAWSTRAGEPSCHFTVSAVVHSGEVVAELGAGEQTGSVVLTGDVVPLATRLATQVNPSGVSVTAATRKLLQAFFEVEPAGSQRVRGAAAPVEMFHVKGEAQSRNRVDLVDPGNLTPLIGRDTEFGILKDRWEQANEGRGQLVLLTGDAGLGKSRLIRELREYVRGNTGGTGVFEWRCSAYHVNTGLYPTIECFDRLIGPHPHGSVENRYSQLKSFLDFCGLASTENEVLFATFLSVPLPEGMPPLALTPQKQKERTIELILAWLAAVARRQPVLFIVEDLHWADPTTLEFLTRLAETGGGDTVLTILTARPEFRPPWPVRSEHAQIPLNRLTKRQIAEMVKRRLGRNDVPQVVLDRIADRTDGVPLFVEEFTSLIQESGCLDQGGVNEAALLQVIPASLQDLLVARLQRMASDPQVVQLAASIGREFSHELLAAVSELSEMQLRGELDKLVAAELLFRKGRPPHCSYIFKHALIQDAAYGSLLKKTRAEFHKQIADVLEKQFAGVAANQPELLARHLSAAGEPRRAAEYWLKAGLAAQARSALLEAIQHCKSGLEQVKVLPASLDRDQFELRFQLLLAPVLLQAKGYSVPEVVEAFDRAEAIGTRLGESGPLFHILFGKWMYWSVRGDYATAQPIAERALALAEASNDNGKLMEACFPMANTLHYRGRFREALAFGERGVPLYNGEQAKFYAQFTGQNNGVALPMYAAMPAWQLGQTEKAWNYMNLAVERARGLKDPFALCLSLFHHAWLAELCRDGGRAGRSGEECMKISQEFGMPFFVVLAMENLGMAKILTQPPSTAAYSEGVELLRKSIDSFRGIGAGMHITVMWAFHAEAQCRQGRLDDAALSVSEGMMQAEKTGEVFAVPELIRVMGEIEKSRNSKDVAKAHFAKALEAACESESVGWQRRIEESIANVGG